MRRLPGLLVGLVGFGLGIALMAQSALGLGPWEVLNQGVGLRLGIPMGTASILLGVPDPAGLDPAPRAARPRHAHQHRAHRLWPRTSGCCIFPSPPADAFALRLAELAAGILVIGVSSGLYLAADLGPGPRDGLMTGIHHRFGWSIARARAGASRCRSWLSAGCWAGRSASGRSPSPSASGRSCRSRWASSIGRVGSCAGGRRWTRAGPGRGRGDRTREAGLPGRGDHGHRLAVPADHRPRPGARRLRHVPGLAA